MTESSGPICSRCGFAFSSPEPRIACPVCGETARTWSLRRDVTLEMHGDLAAKQKRPGFPGFVKSVVTRLKRSRRGLLARERLEIDRTDSTKTTKIHLVEEQQPDGTWKLVHDEHVEWPAKRRPPGIQQGS